MPGLVLDLQTDALDPNARCSDLLRKALVVSRKLDVSTIEQWLRCELQGYSKDVEIPDYRRVNGSLKVLNPFQGWQPLYVEDATIASHLASRTFSQPIGELESLVDKDRSSFLMLYFPARIENELMRNMEVPLQPSLHLSPTKIIGILDAVRNAVLEWALELEKQGIFGENMSFSREEKIAANSITYRITNNIGSMQNSQIQHDSPNAVQTIQAGLSLEAVTQFLHSLLTARPELKLSEQESAELDAEITTLQTQLNSPKPKPTIIHESLRSIRSILEGIVSSAIATGLLATLASFS